jgi:hypothetical protein
MDFDSFFKIFFEENVGGPGASYDAQQTLDDLGFGRSDVEKLKSSLNVDCCSSSKVVDLRKAAGNGLFGTKKDLQITALRYAPVEVKNMSGCGARTEVLFIQFVRQWLRETEHWNNKETEEVARNTELTKLFQQSSADSLKNALQKKWGEKISLPTKIDGVTIAGLIGHLGAFREFREWDFQVCFFLFFYFLFFYFFIFYFLHSVDREGDDN